MVPERRSGQGGRLPASYHQNSDLAYNLATRSKRTSGWAARASRADPGGDRCPRRPRRDRARNCTQRHRADGRHAVPERGGHARDLHPQGARAPWRRPASPARSSSPTTAAPTARRTIARAEGARVVPVADKGYGAALMGGIDAARGRFVIMGDADDSYDFGELPKFVDRAARGLRPGPGLPAAVGRRSRPSRRDAARCIAGSATRCSRGLRGAGSARPSTTSTAACAASPRRCTSGSTSGAPGWSSPPR